MAEFLIGFEYTWRVLLRIAGGGAAVGLLVLAVLVVVVAAAVTFDLVTSRLAKRWEKKNHQPRNKLERIILESSRRMGE